MCHVRHTLALMCAKNHLLTFSSFLDIWENVEWPRFFGPPGKHTILLHWVVRTSDKPFNAYLLIVIFRQYLLDIVSKFEILISTHP